MRKAHSDGLLTFSNTPGSPEALWRCFWWHGVLHGAATTSFGIQCVAFEAEGPQSRATFGLSGMPHRAACGWHQRHNSADKASRDARTSWRESMKPLILLE